MFMTPGHARAQGSAKDPFHYWMKKWPKHLPRNFIVPDVPNRFPIR